MCSNTPLLKHTVLSPTLSHANSYIFYEVANSYEFVGPQVKSSLFI